MQAIDIIDPVRLTVVKSITTDQSGATLSNEGSNGGSANESRTWNDAVYLQVRMPSSVSVDRDGLLPG